MDKAQLFMLLMNQAPKLLDALARNSQEYQLGDSGLDTSTGVAAALNRGYDPALIQEHLISQEPSDILNDLDMTNFDYEHMLENSDNAAGQDLYTGIVPSEGIMHLEGQPSNIKAMAKQSLDDIPAALSENGYHPAEVSALSMLSNNPRVGTPNDPNMLPYQNLWEGLPSEAYQAAPRGNFNQFENSPYDDTDLVSDDDPMDEKAKLFRKLVRGY